MKTKIILEFGCNHNGDIKNAFEMIDAAASLGVWGIKFQKRDLNSMPEHLKLLPRGETNSFGKNYYDHRAALEFTVEQLEQLREYAEKKGLQPIISVFDINSIDDVIKAGFTNIKIPSQLYSNYEINSKLCFYAPKALYLYRSTGMHTLSEILNYQFFTFFDVTFYCRSIYPCPLDKLKIKWFLEIKKELKSGSMGYSSHEVHGEAIPLFVTLGAQYIERHFTLDKKMKGTDHSTVSSDIKEIAQIMDEVEQAEKNIECPELCAEEEKVKKKYRGFY